MFKVKNKINNLKSLLFHFLGNFKINDPTTPNLSINLKLPPVGFLKYVVNGSNYPPQNEKELRAHSCNFSIGNCIEKVQLQAKNPIKKWAATNLLKIEPDAGPELNAYYDRRSLKFFYTRFKGKNVYFSESQDIVCHELGHALLDAIRPDFWSVQSLEIWSFHEAFSDIVSMFNLMNYDQAIKMAIEETNGDLNKSNVISRLAEEVGIMIRQLTKDSSFLENALRDPAIEVFQYIDPKTLPKESPNNLLAAECHSFGRVFSHAWYRMFVEIYEYHLSMGNTPEDSVKISRDLSFSILIKAIPNTSRVVKYYENVAHSMIAVASSKGYAYEKIVKDTFLKCKIIKENLKIMSKKSWREMSRNLKKEDVVFKNKNYTIACLKSNLKINSSELPRFGIMSSNKNFEIEVPADCYYKFDKKGNLLEESIPNEQEIKESTIDCLKMLSLGKNKMWNVEKGKLIRKFIQ